MPRRSILSAAERESLLALPDSRDDLIRRYTLTESDISIIRQRRGTANRLGFAVQLCATLTIQLVQKIGHASLAYERHDVRGVREFLTDDYTLTDSRGVVTTKQDDLDDFLKDRIRYTSFRNSNMNVRLYPNAATVIGQTHVEGITNGSSFVVNVQFTDTLVFLHGKWRLATGHVSRLPRS